MNNLTQTQIDAKQAYLNRQVEKMFGIYQSAENNERSAIIKKNRFISRNSPERCKSLLVKVSPQT